MLELQVSSVTGGVFTKCGRHLLLLNLIMTKEILGLPTQGDGLHISAAPNQK